MTTPKVISSEKVYKGRVFDVFLDKIRDGDVEYERDVVTHNGSAVIVPVFADKTVALVKQYRRPAQKYLYEIPAGSLDKNENPEAGARRELEEEIGVTAGKLEKLSEFYVSPGFLSEKMFVFLATDLTETGQNLEADEILEIKRFTFEQVFEMIRKSEIEDAKTIVGLIFAGAKFGLNF
ncbi:MAG TPA: NUDIX hydrolase [Pyrinomonadaceae bacterium]|nr:NUDIX hydrolase [Pyrinomonadaceae bacterium]